MANASIGLAGIAVLLVLLALRVPIGVSLIGVSFAGMWAIAGQNAAWGLVRSVPYAFTASWTLSSVPMFLLMGFLCYHGGLTRGLFDAARVWLTRVPGGLAISATFGAAGFAAVTGSSVACGAAMGRIAVPEMMRYRYDASLATGTVAAAGTIGALIPPSILMIIYGVIVQVPISHLFLGGVGAGLLTVAGYVVVILVRVALNPELAPRHGETFTVAEKLATLRETWPVLVLIVGVLGGLFSGLFTPTESGAVGAAFALVVGLVKRSLSFEAFKRSVTETVSTTAILFVIAIGATMMSRFFAISGTGNFLAGVVIGDEVNPVMLMLGIVVLYLILGMFLEPMGAMLVTLPILLPMVDAAGFNLIWFGVFLVKLLEIGMITPPIGLNVFVIKSVVGDLTTTSNIFRGVAWFIAADAVNIALLLMFPAIILFLPSLAG